MNELPMWWLIISAVFFVINIFFFIGMIFAGMTLLRMIKEMQPKVTALTERVDSIGKHVEELAISARTTVEGVGGRAKSVVTSVDSIAHMASAQFERFSPLFVGALTAIRLVKALGEVRKGAGVGKATSKKALEPRKKRK